MEDRNHEFSSDELDEDYEDEVVLEDIRGELKARHDANGLVLTWFQGGVDDGTEMLRFNPSTNLLRIFPRIRRNLGFENPFEQLTELQVEAPDWDPEQHSEEGERYGLHVKGLPKGFSAVYSFGLGVKRAYRGLLQEIEKHTSCTAIRFVFSATEGQDGAVFRLGLHRFEDYRQAVERNRSRGHTAVRRVIAAEAHNAVADLLAQKPIEPKYGRHPVIQALTEEVATGHVMDAADRAALVERVVYEAPKVAHEAPAQFGRLRRDIELVSLNVLIEQFEEGLVGRAARHEEHWQRFFTTNQFALQQVFSAPILVLRAQAHVRGTDALGQGSRIADFLCINAITRSCIVVEIKTPATALMAANAYRGSGSDGVYPVHKDLSGAVSQVQAQMESVPRDLKHKPELGEIDKWHVRGAVISGKVSELSDEQRESFLRYREGLTSVTVLGYDEVCERLKYLHAMLKDPQVPAADVAAAGGASGASTPER